MNGPARTLPLDGVIAGARLAADVCDAAGRVLLATGTELSDAALNSLRQRGVPHVTVAEPLSDAELAELRADVVKRVEHLFRNTTGDPIMRGMHDAVLAHHLKRLQ